MGVFYQRAYSRMTTVATQINAQTGEIERLTAFMVPTTVDDLHHMAVTKSLKIQKHVLAHQNAQRAIQILSDESSNHTNQCHLSGLTFAFASSAVCNIASSPALVIPAEDYQLRLRAHLQLPCMLAPIRDVPTHELMRQQATTTAVHNSIRDAILEGAALADHFVKAEPTDLYEGPTRVDGVIEREDNQGYISSSVNNRIAFDVFTAADPDSLTRNTAAKRDKHAADVEAAGDEFVAPAFTPSGTPYPSAIKFFRRIAHSGDKLDRSAGRDAPRFHHECTASTFMTPTHVAFMVHMCAAATARASAKAARLYAHERATRHSLRENTLNRPAIIPAPF